MGKYAPYYIVLPDVVIFRNVTKTSNMEYCISPYQYMRAEEHVCELVQQQS
jgi:hypothetical protein